MWTYWGRHGGGAFSGKDPMKVDRLGAFMVRYIAKNLINSNACERADVQIAYAIRRKEPMGVYIDMFGTGELQFELKKPIYKQLATYGSFGHKHLNLSWEKNNKLYGGLEISLNSYKNEYKSVA